MECAFALRGACLTEFMNIRRFGFLALVPMVTFCAGATPEVQDFTEFDLATLMGMDVTVTSVTKREQTSQDAAAAVYVITREDIRRSGATSLPEVLRLAPGLQVARLNNRAWAITARGFNNRFASKLLVMIDGRNIYTPQFSGVVWEEHAIALEDIERIEIVRGPGGALWGINAVNGVINVITRSAAQSQGIEASAGSGSDEQRSARFSFGGTADAVGHYQLHVSHADHQSFPVTGGMSTTRAGVRVDRDLGIGELTLQGDYTRGEFGEPPLAAESSLALSSRGSNVSACWSANVESGRLEISSYYSDTERGVPNRWSERSFGIDTEYSTQRIGRHQFTAGVDYHFASDSLGQPTLALNLTDTEVSQHQWGVYAQDEVHFFDDAVRVVLGAKLEDLEYTGLAFQPTLRSIWRMNERHTVWAAASRAVRTPSRVELHSRMTTYDSQPMGSVVVGVNGSDRLRAEDLRAYELGWRWRPLQNISFDAAFYRHDYDHLIGMAGGEPVFDFFPVPALYVDLDFVNLPRARVDGAEAVIEWAATPWMRLEAQGNWIDTRVEGPPTVPQDPKESYALRAQFDLPRDVELDMSWRSVSRLSSVILTIPSYDALDMRVAWAITPRVEVSLSVSNVLDNRHSEFSQDLTLTPGVTLGRTAFARFVWSPAK